jgi:4-hydroxybenzoate polyprenyltransferase
MAHSTLPITNQAETDRSTVLSLVVSLRPAQWTKNLFVFGALLFGQRGAVPAFLDGSAVVHALGAFAVFCALSGVVYLVNDVADRENDRLHPLKRFRPIASGAVSPGLALGTAVLLAVGALGAAYALRPAFALVSLTYLVLLSLYSGVLKHMVILDVITLATGFVLRAAGGAVAIDVPISHWLLILIMLLALVLALS